MLVFSYLDSIKYKLQEKDIERRITNKKEELQLADLELDELNTSLLDLKNEIQTINEKEADKIKFYDEMSVVSTIRSDFGARLYDALNTRGILKTYTDKIEIAKDKALILQDSIFYEKDGAVVNKSTSELFKFLAKALLEMMEKPEYQKYVHKIQIEVHTKEGCSDDDAILASARGISFKKALLGANKEFNDKYGKKVIVENRFDSEIFYKEEGDEAKNDRIEISVSFNDAALTSEISKLVIQK
ncbi:MAG: hypothetical protein MJ246_08190 [Clostridia bacterium]|nr:hypothetical protein [Clostridia bacterium]